MPNMERCAEERKEALAQSTEMEPIQGTIDIDVPITVLWEAFSQPKLWPRWNRCFFWVRNKSLVLNQKLVWMFQPLRWYYLYKMFALANIVELEPKRIVTWEVTALPGFYARHTYHMEDLGNGRTRFGSWEQAMGWQIKLAPLRRFWTAHFTFVKDCSLDGARQLESLYLREGRIAEHRLPSRSPWWALVRWVLAVLLLAAGSAAAWFYQSYVRLSAVQIVPGVVAVFGGGGNSLLVQDSDELLLVDTKFPPASKMLRRMIARRFNVPVRIIVNTHYHYDHTEGNVEYFGAQIFAHRHVPGLMEKHDGKYWSDHRSAMPNLLVDDSRTIRIGAQEISLIYPGPAHTTADLYVYLRRGGREIVATGDLVFNSYYPMMDMAEGGMDLHGLESAVRRLAARFPNAVFLPGHGPLATVADVEHYANYLQSLDDQVAQARSKGESEDDAVSSIDLSTWHLKPLPSFHNGHWCWSNSARDIRWVYELEAGTRQGPTNCTF
jgi:cyclase